MGSRGRDPTRQAPAGRGTMEVYTPFGMQLFIGLNWAGGLSGMILGTLVVNQGFFEIYFDTQFLLIGQGVALVTLGAAMFITATGLVSGAVWSLASAKRVAGISVIWSALGVTLAAYSAYNLPGLASSVVMYAIAVWLLAFGAGLGLFGLRYLYLNSGSIRRYSEYVSQEVLLEGRDVLPPLLVESPPARRALPYTRGRYCLNCGGTLEENWITCPRCGAETSVRKVS